MTVSHRRSNDHWHEYVVAVISYAEGEVLRSPHGALHKAEEDYTNRCEEFPAESGFRVELVKYEMLGDTPSYRFDLRARLPAKPKVNE